MEDKECYKINIVVLLLLFFCIYFASHFNFSMLLYNIMRFS